MSAIGENDLVECVASADSSFVSAPVTAGSLYRVRKITAGLNGCRFCNVAHPAIQLEGQTYRLAPDGREIGWCPHRFRPLPPRRWLAELLNVETPVSIDHPERVDG